jgi:hypothetical protein
MRYRSLAAFGISLALIGVGARAYAVDQEDDDAAPAQGAKGAKGTETGDDASDDAKGSADESPKKKSKASSASDDAKHEIEETPPDAQGDFEATMAGRIVPAKESDGRPPVYGKRSDWVIDPYGYARLDAIEDSTESFADGIQPNLIQRAGTYAGDHPRTIVTARDSRLGVYVVAPTYQGIKSSSQIEFDFYGLVPTDARIHDSVVFGPVRIRLAYLKLETPIFDVFAGQYYDLFGWNGSFYVGTVGYLGVPAEVYHRNPQLRIQKTLHLGPLEVTAAVAAVRPGDRDSGLPEAQGGLKIAVPGWSGAATAGFGRPFLSPLSIGVSGLYRAFVLPVFRAEPGSESVTTYGWGAAVQAVVPVIPVKKLVDRGNALTLVGEYTIGTGIADMYTFMDGGSRLPVLPNPSLAQPAAIYPSNIDPGLVTFDRNFNLKTINWQALVGNVQYFLPIDHGRVWVQGTYSRIWSNNIKDLTPFASWGGIFTEMDYYDGNLGIDITPAIALGLSFQSVHQTFGDLSVPTPVYGAIPTPGMVGQGLSVPGTGGVAASARNNRGQVSMAFYF